MRTLIAGTHVLGGGWLNTNDELSAEGTMWAKTRWSIVSGLDQRDDPAWQAAWAFLSTSYERPMLIYAERLLARAPGGRVSAQDARDVVQEFLTTCIEKDWLPRADPRRGKFRAYVQILLRRYVTRWLRRRLAKKRRPAEGISLLPLLPEDEEHMPSSAEAADLEAFDRSWSRVAIERALERLQRKSNRYGLVIRDLIDTEGEGSADLPDQLEGGRGQFPVTKHRAKKQFASLFREELSSTVADPAAFEEEWNALSRYLPG